jgi:hypothetical protein
MAHLLASLRLRSRSNRPKQQSNFSRRCLQVYFISPTSPFLCEDRVFLSGCFSFFIFFFSFFLAVERSCECGRSAGGGPVWAETAIGRQHGWYADTDSNAANSDVPAAKICRFRVAYFARESYRRTGFGSAVGIAAKEWRTQLLDPRCKIVPAKTIPAASSVRIDGHKCIPPRSAAKGVARSQGCRHGCACTHERTVNLTLSRATQW